VASQAEARARPGARGRELEGLGGYGSGERGGPGALGYAEEGKSGSGDRVLRSHNR
jgi:hypothetical protein